MDRMNMEGAYGTERGTDCLLMHLPTSGKWSSFRVEAFLVLFTSYLLDNHQLIKSATINASEEGHVQGLEERESWYSHSG